MTTPDSTPQPGSPVMLAPEDGRTIVGGAVHANLKVTLDHPSYASSFEMRVAPGFDVGAHVHGNGEEMFYVVDGQLDVFCFEPLDRSLGDWHEWTSSSGQKYLRGGPGSFMYVPPGVPHAFANSTDTPVTMFFQSSVKGGHENYFVELADILGAAQQGKPDENKIKQLMQKYDMTQLTPMKPGTPS